MNKDSDEDKEATAKLIRDSAIILAGVTGLLYLASHIYGAAYVSMFGIASGFQGEGLGNLAMLDTTSVFILIGFAGVVFAALRTDSRAWLCAGLVVVVLVGLGPLFSSLGYGIWPRDQTGGFGTFAISGGGIFAVVMSILLIRFRPLVRMQLLNMRPKALDELAERRRAEIEKATTEEDKLSLQRNLIKIEDAQERFLAERRRYVTIIAALTAGYAAGLGGIPTVAVYDAIDATSVRWERIDAKEAAPTPVYWVGDRLINVTWEQGKCYVHTFVANIERGRRECPPMIAAIGS